jgi:hypothetical protein
MRRAFALLAVLAAVTFAGHARADEPGAWRNTISTNPARYAVLHFQIEYERVFGDAWSAFVAPIFFHHATWYPFAHAEGLTANGYGLDFGARHFFGRAPSGAFVGPYLSAYRGHVLRDGREALEGYVLSPGVQGGYAWLLGRLLLAVGGGLSYGIATDRAPDGSPRAADLPHRGFWINFRANVGVAF